MKNLPKKHRIFFISIYVITLIAFVASVHLGIMKFSISNYKNILFFILLTALTETFTVYYMEMSFSTTFAITLATYILFGPYETTIIFIIGFLLRVLKLDDGTYNHFFNTPFYGTIFNCCVLTFPIFVANYFYTMLEGNFGVKNLFTNIPQLIIFTFIYFLLNTLIISILASLYTGKNILYCYFENIKLCVLNYLAMIPFAIILVIIFTHYGYLGVLFTFFPIVLVRHTFSMYVNSKTQYIQTVQVLMSAIEARDQYTQGHSHRVAEIAINIAKKLEYNDKKIEKLMVAAMLHDVGKIGVSDNILNKPGKLTDEEFVKIKEHPEIGYNILSEVKNLKYVGPIVKHHHERYDGKGYPEGKKEEEIGLDTYIVQLADAVDAMETDRPYRKGLSKEEVISELENNSGTQFHPKVAEVYLNILKSRA